MNEPEPAPRASAFRAELESPRQATWLDGQNEAFRAVANGASLAETLDILVSTALQHVELIGGITPEKAAAKK